MPPEGGGGGGGGGLVGALASPRPTHPPTHIRKIVLWQKMKLIKRPRTLRPILGTKTFFFGPQTPPPSNGLPPTPKRKGRGGECDVLWQASPVSTPADPVLWSGGSARTSCLMSPTVHRCPCVSDPVARCGTCSGYHCTWVSADKPLTALRRASGGMLARRATFVLSVLALAPSLSSPWEVPPVDRTGPQTFCAKHVWAEWLHRPCLLGGPQ